MLINPKSGYAEIGDDLLTLTELKGDVDRMQESDDFKIVKTFNSQIKADGDGAVSTIISDGRKDRDNDVINPEGWDVSGYEKNPVVLWSHDPTIPPIAKSKIKVFKSKMTSKDTFAETEFAQSILELVKGGFINAKSVGFHPTDWDFDEKSGGFVFNKQELLEHSYVSVPANPRALVVARAAGINTQPVIRWAEKTLDEWTDNSSVFVPKSSVEAFYNSSSAGSVMFDMSTTTSNDLFQLNDSFWVPIKSADTTTSDWWDLGLGFKASEEEENMDELETKDLDEAEVEFASEDAEKYFSHILKMKAIKSRLESEGFSKEEIEIHAKEIDRLERGDPAPVVEEEKDASEERFEIDTDELAKTIKSAVDEARLTLAEVTGRVN